MRTTIYICPVCGQALREEDRRAVCPAGHSFDRAREGYINLLLSGHGGTHGDNRRMVLCRRAFLGGGYYDMLSDAVCREVLRYVPESGVLLDGGAGECFYTDRMERVLSGAGRAADVYAFDISKEAVRYAAGRNRRLRLFVAGAYHMPVRTESVDVAVNMFAPLATEEILRVLKPGGVFLMAIPEREHLFGLKKVLYETPYYNTVADSRLPGFSLLSSEEIRRDVTLRGHDVIENLFGMTPYAYRTSAEGCARVAALTEVTTPFHFRLFVYRKNV